MRCQYFGKCSGCAWHELSLDDQARQKAHHFVELLKSHSLRYPDLEMKSPVEWQFRDKLDVTLEQVNGKPQLGFYSVEKRAIVDIDECPLLTPELNAFYQDFRKNLPAIQKGSFRFRHSPEAGLGIWLDLANVDVKSLLDEGQWLRELNQKATVEIGQKRKRLIEKEGQLKLGAPELKAWFASFDKEGKELPLFICVGGFSQPSRQANQTLVEKVIEIALASQKTEWMDLFCGSGNFTLALASAGFSVEALEMDELAVLGVQKSLEHQAQLGRKLQVKAQRQNLYSSRQPLDLTGKSLVVDPPRSGLGRLLDLITTESGPEELIYVSCFAESLITDLVKLSEAGFQIKSMTGIDQFPHTPHCEWVVHLVK